MRENSFDQRTKQFYQTPQIAIDYEKIRFAGRAGVAGDDLQKKAVFSLVDSTKIQGAQLLDVGCGTGRFSRFFSEKGAKVTSLDASLAMLYTAKGQDNERSYYLASSALALPFPDNSFDIALSVNVLNHLASYEQAISEICRVSKKVILSVPNKHSILLLAYAYRFLKGIKTTDSICYAAKKYEDAVALPYSIYFSVSELKRLLESNGMRNIRVTGCLFTFYLPEVATNVFKRIDEILSPYFGQFGSAIAITGEK